MKTVLLIGATGTFGSRLAQNLSSIAGLHLLLTSRNIERAQAVIDNIAKTNPKASLQALQFGSQNNLSALLNQHKPWLVVDATGPFQLMSYDTPRAAIAAGAHYLDLADGAEFLKGFAAALNTAAREKNVVAISGTSTTPALTTAVVDQITKGWKRVDSIDMVLVPASHTSVGVALIKGMLAQAGGDITTFKHGALATVKSWLGTKRHTIRNLGTFSAAPIETIEPFIMPERYKVTSRIMFRAGLPSKAEQWGIQCFALLRHFGIFKNAAALSPLMAKGRSFTRHFNNDRSGMTVQATGLDEQGKWTEKTWTMLAEKGDGPHVPTLAIVAATRMLMANELPSGAQVAIGTIPLERFDAELKPFAISTTVSSHEARKEPFAAAIGSAGWTTLPTALRHFHSDAARPIWNGIAQIEAGKNPLARIVSRMIGLPKSGRDVPLRVSIERTHSGEETWARNFAGQVFQSHFRLADDNTMRERFGPLEIALGISQKEKQIHYPVNAARLFGIPVPKFLLPTSSTFESEDNHGRFNFCVDVGLPFVGPLITYKGWLTPQQ
jgi:saccharopine dehydrogenase-like NADP-dependent oxidoreductase